MTTRKRNEWLDADDGSDDGESYNSEEESRGRSAAGRAAKRRKADSDDSDDSDAESSVDGQPAVTERPNEDYRVKGDDDYDDQDDRDDDDDNGHKSRRRDDSELQRLLHLRKALPESRFNIAAFEDEDEDDDDDDDDPSTTATTAASRRKPPALPKISKTSAAAAEKAARRTGVLYLSRIPPFMKPSTLRSLLAPYGALNRIFLTPEAGSAHAARVRAGGNKKKSYTDGWVEFVDKREAKTCAAVLNGRPVGGRGWYRDDVWVMKYLRGFKWADLTGQLAEENAERAARVRAEVARGTRESKRFVEGVERGKMLEAMGRRRRGGRGQDDGGEDVGAGTGTGTGGGTDALSESGRVGGDGPALQEETFGEDSLAGGGHKARRARKSFFRQNEVREKLGKVEPADQPSEVKRVLSKIF